MRRVDVAEARHGLPELIRAAAAGEDVVIVGENGTGVRLVAVEMRGRPRFGSAKGMFTMRDDFDAPLDDFAPYER
jgi:antitoxin (DNA-binding transcriptional repressor) of toxin-antitoxin stability system